MKKTFLVLLSIVYLFISTVYSQAPESFNYQAVIRDAGGQVMSNKTKVIKVEITDAPVSGNVVYSEDHSVTTNQFGLINIAIGQGIYQGNPLDSINWGASNYYLEIFIDPTGQGNFIKYGFKSIVKCSLCTIC